MASNVSSSKPRLADGAVVMDLPALARRYELAVCAELVAPSSLSSHADTDPSLQSPPATEDPPRAIDQMCRRGLEPRLVRSVLDWLAPHPLEVALFFAIATRVALRADVTKQLWGAKIVRKRLFAPVAS